LRSKLFYRLFPNWSPKIENQN